MKKRTARIISAAAVLTMCLSTGCGSIEEASPAAAQAPEVTEAAAETEITLGDDTKAAATEETPAAAEETTEGSADVSYTAKIFNDENSVIISEDENYNKAAVYRMAELALEQYDLIVDRDKQGYFDSMNFPALLGNDAIYALFSEENEDRYSAASELLYMALSVGGTILPEEQAALFEGRPDDMDAAEYDKKLREAVEAVKKSISAETVTELFEDYSPFNAFFGSESEYYLPEGFANTAENLRVTSDKDTKYMIAAEEYTEDETGKYAYIGVAAMKGDWIYTIEAAEWLGNNGESSVFITDMDIDENEYKGMELSEIVEKHEKLSKQKALNANAKTGYNIAAEYFADQEIAGKTIDEVFENGSFKLITSESGLSLSDTSSEHGEGDEHFFTVMNDCGFTEGTFYLGRVKIRGEDTFFIQFKTDDSGLIGQYPNCITGEDSDKPVWKTYYPHDDETAEESAESAKE